MPENSEYTILFQKVKFLGVPMIIGYRVDMYKKVITEDSLDLKLFIISSEC